MSELAAFDGIGLNFWLLQLVAAFLDQIELVGFNVFECLLQAARPLDLHGFGARRFIQAKIGSQIALREIAATALRFREFVKCRQP